MIPETKAFCPLGLGIVPYQLPGSLKLAEETLKELEDYDVVMWEKHGVFAKGFGMNVSAYDAFCPADVIEAAGVHAVKSQDELFQTCDIVSLHIPATPETIKSIDYKTVNQLPKGGILINTAR